MSFFLKESQAALIRRSNLTRRCSRFFSTNGNYTPLLPTEQEFTNMILEASKYIKKDIYHFNDDPDTSQIGGTGYKWLHSKDINELQTNRNIYNKFQEDLPMNGMEFNELLKLYFENINVSTNDNQSGYMSFIPSGGLPTAAIGEFIASSTNRYPTIFNAFPLGASIEECLVKWFCQIIGSPFDNDICGGYLTSGGSMANLMALDIIRDCYMDNNSILTDLTLYCSDEIHYCIAQSAKFIGLPINNLRQIESHSSTKEMDIYQLIETIEYDLKKKKKPIAIIANAGTTNTGAIDDLNEIYNICNKYNLWFHIDAAYGGFFNITERGKTALNGIQFADSIVCDPHKTLFMPYGIGCLLLKNANYLQKSNQFSGACLHPKNSNKLYGIDSSDLSFELTRSFRGLGPWFALKTMGFDTFIAELNNKLDLKIFCQDYIKKKLKYVQIMYSSKLSIFTFQLNLENILADISNEYDAELNIDELNKVFLDKINSKGNILLSAVSNTQSPNQDGQFVIRMIVLSFRTQKSDIIQALKDIEESSKEMFELIKDTIKYNIK